MMRQMHREPCCVESLQGSLSRRSTGVACKSSRGQELPCWPRGGAEQDQFAPGQLVLNSQAAGTHHSLDMAPLPPWNCMTHLTWHHCRPETASPAGCCSAPAAASASAAPRTRRLQAAQLTETGPLFGPLACTAALPRLPVVMTRIDGNGRSRWPATLRLPTLELLIAEPLTPNTAKDDTDSTGIQPVPRCTTHWAHRGLAPT